LSNNRLKNNREVKWQGKRALSHPQAVPDFGLGKLGNCLGPGGAQGPGFGILKGPEICFEILLKSYENRPI